MFFWGPLPSSLTPAASTRAWRAVRPATGRPAASAAGTSGGLMVVKLSLATAYSANPPPVYPTSTTSPATSVAAPARKETDLMSV
nr:hypothetical protein Ahy_B03g067316 isoform C [Ipomoea batatas]